MKEQMTVVRHGRIWFGFRDHNVTGNEGKLVCPECNRGGDYIKILKIEKDVEGKGYKLLVRCRCCDCRFELETDKHD